MTKKQVCSWTTKILHLLSYTLPSSHWEILGIPIPGQCCKRPMGAHWDPLQSFGLQSVCSLCCHHPIFRHGKVKNCRWTCQGSLHRTLKSSGSNLYWCVWSLLGVLEHVLILLSGYLPADHSVQDYLTTTGVTYDHASTFLEVLYSSIQLICFALSIAHSITSD